MRGPEEEPVKHRNGRTRAVVLTAALLTIGLLSAGPAAAGGGGGRGPLGRYKHLVVIYEENHSFDNLYGQWGKRRRPAA